MDGLDHCTPSSGRRPDPEYATVADAVDRLYQAGRDTAASIWSGATVVGESLGRTARESGDALVALGFLPSLILTDGSERVSTPGVDTQEARNRLVEAARERIADPEARRRFLADVDRFSARRDLPESEIRATLDTVRELLQAGDQAGGQNRDIRILAARGIMYNAANPTTLCQIGGTCGAASIERVLYQNQPSVAASMVSAAVRTGSFVGRDGVTISVPACNLTPGGAQLTIPPENPPGSLGSAPASYASQVFLASMFNEIGQHLNPPLRYERNGDNEHWVRPDGRRLDLAATGSTGENGELSMTGGLPAAMVVTGLRRITGRPYHLINNSNFDVDRVPTPEHPITGVSAAGLESVASARELEATLARLQGQGRLPIVISISNQFLRDSVFEAMLRPGQANPLAGAPQNYVPDHFVTVHAFHPGPPARVDIRNSWGDDPMFNRSFTVAQLFGALGNQRPRAR